MKTLLSLLCLCLVACAGTTVYERGTQKKLFHTQSDADYIEYSDGNTKFVAHKLNHSTPTEAGGKAFAMGTDAIGRGAATALVGAGNSGLFTKTAVISATTVSSFRQKSATPAPATPTPKPTQENGR